MAPALASLRRIELGHHAGAHAWREHELGRPSDDDVVHRVYDDVIRTRVSVRPTLGTHGDADLTVELGPDEAGERGLEFAHGRVCKAAEGGLTYGFACDLPHRVVLREALCGDDRLSLGAVEAEAVECGQIPSQHEDRQRLQTRVIVANDESLRQLRIACARREHDALGSHELHPVVATQELDGSILGADIRVDDGAAVATREHREQAVGIHNLLVESVHRTGNACEGSGTLLVRDLLHRCLQSKRSAELRERGDDRIRPPTQAVCRAKLHLAEGGFPLVSEALPPQRRHVLERAHETGVPTHEGVLETAMQNALRGDGLTGPEGPVLDEERVVAGASEIIEEPEPADASTDNQNFGFERHGTFLLFEL